MNTNFIKKYRFLKKTKTIPSCKDCIKNNTVFKSLHQNDLDILGFEKSCNFYKRGDTVYHEGNRVGGVYCVSEGIIKIFKTGIDGKEQIIRFAKKGDIIGFRSVLSNDTACTTSKVIEDATLCFIPAESFINLVKENGDFSMKIMKLSCKELGEANKFIIDIAQKNVRERLAEVLLLLDDTFGTDNNKILQISLTREELANIVGTATESVIRLLSEFKQDGLIKLNGRKITLLDINKLHKISDIF